MPISYIESILRYAVDPTTKEILESIITEGRAKRPAKAGVSDPLSGRMPKDAAWRKRAEDHRLAMEEMRRHASAVHDEMHVDLDDPAYRAAPRREKPSETFYADMPIMNADTLDKVAVVCVNTAKACIVLRADLSYHVASELQKITNGKDILYNRKDGVVEFHPRFLPDIKKLLTGAYRHVSVLAAQKAVKPTKFDLLLSKLSTDDKKSMYSLLAKRYHPDLPTGNKDIMTLVNLVFKGGD